MRSKTTSTALWALLSTLVSCHTWVEQMSVLDDSGAYSGTPGYPRGFVPRTDPGFNDDAMTERLPVTGRTGPDDAANRVVSTDTVCASSQASPATQNAAYPPLVAGPGNYVALRYLENGHVSMPDNQPGKPGSGGLVYVYATTNNKVNPKILDVMTWKADSSLDQGRLLAINSFDDGRCHQMRNALPTDPPPPWRNFSPQRQKEFNNNGELACETDIQIPKDAKDSLTLFWVWQWPYLPNQKDASGKPIGIPTGKDEIYTTCMDITIGSPTKRRTIPAAAIPGNAQSGSSASSANSSPGASYKLVGIVNPLITTAPSNYKERAANVTIPTDTAFYGPNNPRGMPHPGDTSADASSSTPVGGKAPIIGGSDPNYKPSASPAAPVPKASQPPAAAVPVPAGAQGGYNGSPKPNSVNTQNPAPAPPAPTPAAIAPSPAVAPPPQFKTVTQYVTVTAPAVPAASPAAEAAKGPAGCRAGLPLPADLLSSLGGFIGAAPAPGAAGPAAAKGSGAGSRLGAKRKHAKFFSRVTIG